MDVPLTEEQIRTLAFYLWEKDGSPGGRADEYWEKAQRQLAGEDDTPTAEQGGSEQSHDSLTKPTFVTPNDI
jgi:uncharacterized membrane protein